MRRYTTVKSNVYAPISTDLLSQNTIHNHMVSHYRMTYFARSKVDTSPPWKYKTRDFVSPERVRNKTSKPTTTPGKASKTVRPELEEQNNSLVGSLHYDPKDITTVYKSESISLRRHIISEPKRKDIRRSEKSKNKVQNDTFKQEKIDCVPSLNMPLKKKRLTPQFVNWQTWTKKLLCSNKRNIIYGKQKAIPQDHLRESIPRTLGKSRMYHPITSHHRDLQDNRGCVNSGSEGNAGDDKVCTPISSFDDLNQSPRDIQKTSLSTHRVSNIESYSSHKCILEKGKQDPCLCLTPIKEAGSTGSRASSRDSAYEGGEGMFPTENQRNSPDECEGESNWFQRCIVSDYEKKGNGMIQNVPQDTSLFWRKKCSSMENVCGKSEFYMKFLQDVTDDVLVQAVYSNEAIERVFQDHVDCNAYALDVDHLKLMIDKLKDDLGITAEHCYHKHLHNDRREQELNVSNVLSKVENEWSCKTSAVETESSGIAGTQFVSVLRDIVGNDEMRCSWTKKLFQEEQNSCPYLIKIDQKISMSKREIMEYLSEMGFDHPVSEEIFHILAGNSSLIPELPIRKTMKH